jgi:Periplasmic protein TonB, links inner and outer membranes
MSAARLLILENIRGQKVRTFATNSDSLNIVYLRESRRVEAYSDLETLKSNNIAFDVIQKVQVSRLTEDGMALENLGRLRILPSEKAVNSPTYELMEENDEEELKTLLQKTSLAHIAVVFCLIMGSWAFNRWFNKPAEPALVTIMMPETPKQPEVVKPEKRPTVKVSEKKIKPSNKVYKPVVQKKVLKSKPYKVVTEKARDVRRVGALAALGGVAKGARDAEGLDLQSMKNIRSAGTGRGGGGVGGSGRGGMKGYMPGSGLIAGSAGEGARAESAGGYGTRGTGGGRAGYGKISLVGGTNAVSLPLDDEATVEGGLDRDQIIAVINKNRGQIIACYERGLQSQPTIGGRVSVSFVINAAGRISVANVKKSSLGSKSVEGCMIARMKSWQFPRPVGRVNVDVLYPFELMRVSAR